MEVRCVPTTIKEFKNLNYWSNIFKGCCCFSVSVMNILGIVWMAINATLSTTYLGLLGMLMIMSIFGYLGKYHQLSNTYCSHLVWTV